VITLISLLISTTPGKYVMVEQSYFSSRKIHARINQFALGRKGEEGGSSLARSQTQASRERATHWLESNFDKVGVESSVDIEARFL
ncbi:MAG: hypothetical protein AAF543_20135, partial [Pseudomonadota bacterium]